MTQRDPLLVHLPDSLGEGQHGQEATGVHHGQDLTGPALECPLDGHQRFALRQGHLPREDDVIPRACVLDSSVSER